MIYGLNGYKVHSKLCLISRKTDKGVSYITQIGTGNYNEKTSALYTDLSLITANQEIGKEAAEVFAALLKGEVVEKSNLLLVAPKCLQNRVLDMIQEEIDQVKQGKEGYIGIKINSLTDKVIINKLVEASQAGVKIEMVVRGICCLIPEIKGYTENIKVISIVGRYLEHSRIYRFGTKEREKIYIASADFMTRNTVRRVEVAAPVLNEKLKERLDWMFETMMNDDEKGKRLTETGNYADRSLNDCIFFKCCSIFHDVNIYSGFFHRKNLVIQISENFPDFLHFSFISCGKYQFLFQNAASQKTYAFYITSNIFDIFILNIFC